MAIAFDQASGTASNSASSLIIDITAAAAGAWVYCHVQISSNVGATTFTGWTLVHEQDESTFDHAALWRRLKVAGDTTFTVSWTGAQGATASWASYTGVDSTTPDESATQLDHTASSASYITASATPTATNRWALSTYGYRSTTAARTWTNATATQRVDTENTTSRFSGSSIADSNGTVAQSSQSFTATLSAAETHGSTFILFLIPAAAAAGGFYYPIPHFGSPVGPVVARRFHHTFIQVIFPPNSTVQNLQQTLTATLSFTGNLSLSTSKKVPATLSFTGAQSRNIFIHLNGTLSFTGNLFRAITTKLVGAILSFSGNLPRQINTKLTATLGFAGNQIRAINKGLAATLSFAGNLPRNIKTNLTATLSFVGNLPKLVSKNLSTATLTFTGNLVSNKVILVVLTAALNFAGAISRQTNKGLPASLSFNGNINKAISKGIAATLSFVGNLPKLIQKGLIASLGFAGALTSALSHLANFNPLKSLILTFDDTELGTTLGLHGDTIPVSIVTVAPSGAPPGNVGIQFQVSAGVLTIWVWDGANWQSK